MAIRAHPKKDQVDDRQIACGAWQDVSGKVQHLTSVMFSSLVDRKTFFDAKYV